MSDPHSPHPKNRLPSLLLTALLLACGYLTVRALVPPKPAAFAKTRSVPIDAQWSDGAWYWIEREAKKPQRLVRADSSEPRDLASADEIPAFDVQGDSIYWSWRRGKEYGISRAAKGGGSAADLCTLSTKPQGLRAEPHGSEATVWWLESTAPAVPDCEPFPPLGSQTRLMQLSLASGGRGASPEEVCTVMEPEGKEVLGAVGNEITFSTFRPGALGTTAIYRTNGREAPVRIAGVPAKNDALLTGDGTLYWLGASREAGSPQSTSSVRRLTRDRKVERLTDWLPYGGYLVDAGGRILYVDNTYSSQAWAVGDGRELPRPLATPEGYGVLGVGGGDILLRPITEANPRTISLYRMRLP